MLWRQNTKSYNPDKTFIPRIFYYFKFNSNSRLELYNFPIPKSVSDASDEQLTSLNC